MMKPKPGTVVLIRFPFTDLHSSKLRPAVIISTKAEDFIILGIFSRIPGELQESWIKIEETDPGFSQTGLQKTSIIKTEKIAVVHRSLVRKELGSIPSELMQKVKRALRKTLEIDEL
jgi:mRNA interferase MazF